MQHVHAVEPGADDRHVDGARGRARMPALEGLGCLLVHALSAPVLQGAGLTPPRRRMHRATARRGRWTARENAPCIRASMYPKCGRTVAAAIPPLVSSRSPPY